LALALTLGGCLAASYAGAQGQAAARGSVDSSADRVIKKVRLDQKLNAQVPLDATFRDDAGRVVKLRDYSGSKPLMLMLIQYRCRMLCSEEMNTLLRSLKELKFDTGNQFDLAVISIDSRETPSLAAEKKQSYIREYGRPEAARGWHFLTGDDANINKVAESIGFHFTYDPKTDQFAHPDGVIILTPEGRVARYFFRLDYPAQGLRYALVEAAKHRIGSPLDYIALLCYHYDPQTGRYGVALMKVMRLAGLTTVFALAVGVLALKRRDRHPSGGAH
jgi:protein SCO1/2